MFVYDCLLTSLKHACNCTDRQQIYMFTFYCAADKVVSVNGTYVEVPDATNTEVNLCISFESSSSSDRIVVLAHHRGDPEKLSAFCLNSTNCTEAPPAGNYSIGVFNQTAGSILTPPAMSPTISIHTVPISEC